MVVSGACAQISKHRVGMSGEVVVCRQVMVVEVEVVVICRPVIEDSDNSMSLAGSHI